MLKRAYLAIGLSSSLLYVGCDGATRNVGANPDESALSNATAARVSPTTSSYFDWSNTIETKVFSSGAVQNGKAVCQVDLQQGWVAIGGGGRVDCPNCKYGAFLKSSRPLDGDLNKGWEVTASDHLYANSYYVTCQVIGIRIKGISQAELKNAISVTVNNSGAGHTPTQTAVIPSGQILVGGGAYIHDEQPYGGPGTGIAGAFLTTTAPELSNPGTWRASSKDHQVACIHQVTSYAIGIKSKFSNGLSIIGRPTVGNSSQWISTGGSDVTVNGDADFAPTSAGASVNWDAWNGGRMLMKSEIGNNLYQSSTALSGDNLYASSGTTTAYILELMKAK